MISIAAADQLLDGDLSPEAISSFVDRQDYPLSTLGEVRRELAKLAQGPLVPPIEPGKMRPLAKGAWLATDLEGALDSVWATLLYSHTAAVYDPLERRNWAKELTSEGEKAAALQALSALTVVRPLVDAGVLVLVPSDLLPEVKLDFSRLTARLNGRRALIFAMLKGETFDELSVLPRASFHMQTLELLASTGWSIQVEPLSAAGWSEVSQYALNVLLREGRRRLLSQRVQDAFLGRFDAFAIDTLTRVPVPDLSNLAVGDIQRIRDEDAFGAWRVELEGVIGEYERNVGAAMPSAAGIASERLGRSAASVDRAIAASGALSAIRAGMSTFAIAGSAALATFPILSAGETADSLGLAAGASLIETGRRLVFCQRSPMAVTRQRHYRAAEAIFAAAPAV